MMKKFLIVDDSRAIHAFIKDTLSGTHNIFVDAFDGYEALEHLSETTDFSAILLDWEMPRLTGIDTLREIRRRGITTPVIMVTSLTEERHIQEALTAGANEYIMKPFTKDILESKISDLVHGA